MGQTVLAMRRSRARTKVLIGLALAALVATTVTMWMRGAAPASHGPRPEIMRPLINVPVLGVPQPGPLQYHGGPVQVTPKVYMVFWGWASSADPVAVHMQNFVSALGGTPLMALDDQYYESSNGVLRYVTNPPQLLNGVWFDNVDPIKNGLSMQDIASEALVGLRHFGITDFANSTVVVAQPANANDAGFNASQYCAWHDWSTDGYTFPAGTPGFAFISMPYVINAGAGCGEDSVNPAPAGDLDGTSIVLGHEIAEDATDPGAGVAGLTGWLDLNGEENADKCQGVIVGPGAQTNITGNDGRSYAVQGLWDNGALLGLGYCAN
jgi:hypothetical protein